MKSTDFSTYIHSSCNGCAEVFNEILQDTNAYLATHASLSKDFFFAQALPSKEISFSYYQYAARLSHQWDRIAEHLVKIGRVMQSADAEMDSKTVLRCDALLIQGNQFQSTLNEYLTQCEAILKSDAPLSQLQTQTKRLLFAAEQSRLFFMTEAH